MSVTIVQHTYLLGLSGILIRDSGNSTGIVIVRYDSLSLSRITCLDGLCNSIDHSSCSYVIVIVSIMQRHIMHRNII